LKTLDVAIAQHKTKLQAVKEERQADQQKVDEVIAQAVGKVEKKHVERMRENAEEETRRRRDTQQSLRRQIEGESAARIAHVTSEYEAALERERVAGAAKLVQAHSRISKEYRLVRIPSHHNRGPLARECQRGRARAGYRA
jgi:hypothetical protein